MFYNSKLVCYPTYRKHRIYPVCLFWQKNMMKSLSINGVTYIYIKLFRLNRVTVTLEFKFDAQPQDISRYTVLF